MVNKFLNIIIIVLQGPFDYWGIARTSTSTRIYRSLPLRRKTIATIPDQSKEQENKNTDNPLQLANDKIKLLNSNVKSLLLKQKSTIPEINIDKTEKITTPRGILKLTPRTFDKLNSTTETKITTPKYGEKKSNIPIFRRNSREYEDISPLRVSSKRSTLIPSWSQRSHRGSADDLRRYRDDSLPSLIPKLLTTQRDKENKNKKTTGTIESPVSRLCTPLTSTIKKDTNVQRDDLKINYQKFLRRDVFQLTTSTSVDATKIKMPIKGKYLKDANCSETEIVDNLSDKMVEINEDLTIKLSDDNETMQQEHYTINHEEDPLDDLLNNQDGIKNIEDTCHGKKMENSTQQRKTSKEEFFGTDDTDDATPNRRWSSHLSPEASPLSTRSSKYSPRESESEPTPALPRKTATSSGESCISSQRIRDAITRTRRESNSSARYESSGSESIRYWS